MAIAACKRLKAKLVIDKLDRLSRNLAFIAALMESGVEFVAVDNPHMNKLTIHILAAVAEHQGEMISERTKAALAAAKRRGQRLGKSQPHRGSNAARPLGRPMRGGLPPMFVRSLRRSCAPVPRATTRLLPSSISGTCVLLAAGCGRMCRWGQFYTLSSQAPARETRQALGALSQPALGTASFFKSQTP